MCCFAIIVVIGWKNHKNLHELIITKVIDIMIFKTDFKSPYVAMGFGIKKVFSVLLPLILISYTFEVPI